MRCSIQVGGPLAGHEIIKSAATPVPLARCPARGRGQVHEALSLSAPLTTTLGGASRLARDMLAYCARTHLGRYCTLDHDHARKRNPRPHRRSAQLRHDSAPKPTQAHGPWLTNPAAPAQTSGRQSGCHFCILPRRGSLLEPAAQLPGPVALVAAGHVCDVHEHVSCVQHTFACRCARNEFTQDLVHSASPLALLLQQTSSSFCPACRVPGRRSCNHRNCLDYSTLANFM